MCEKQTLLQINPHQNQINQTKHCSLVDLAVAPVLVPLGPLDSYCLAHTTPSYTTTNFLKNTFLRLFFLNFETKTSIHTKRQVLIRRPCWCCWCSWLWSCWSIRQKSRRCQTNLPVCYCWHCCLPIQQTYKQSLIEQEELVWFVPAWQRNQSQHCWCCYCCCCWLSYSNHQFANGGWHSIGGNSTNRRTIGRCWITRWLE